MDIFLKFIPFIIVIIGIFILILVIHKMIKYIEELQFEIEKCEKKITNLEILYEANPRHYERINKNEGE